LDVAARRNGIGIGKIDFDRMPFSPTFPTFPSFPSIPSIDSQDLGIVTILLTFDPINPPVFFLDLDPRCPSLYATRSQVLNPDFRSTRAFLKLFCPHGLLRSP